MQTRSRCSDPEWWQHVSDLPAILHDVNEQIRSLAVISRTMHLPSQQLLCTDERLRAFVADHFEWGQLSDIPGITEAVKQILMDAKVPAESGGDSIARLQQVIASAVPRAWKCLDLDWASSMAALDLCKLREGSSLHQPVVARTRSGLVYVYSGVAQQSVYGEGSQPVIVLHVAHVKEGKLFFLPLVRGCGALSGNDSLASSGFSVATFNDKLFVFGGQRSGITAQAERAASGVGVSTSGTCTNKLHRFSANPGDARGPSWSVVDVLGAVPCPRTGHVVAVDEAGKRMYLYGGQTRATMLQAARAGARGAVLTKEGLATPDGGHGK